MLEMKAASFLGKNYFLKNTDFSELGQYLHINFSVSFWLRA